MLGSCLNVFLTQVSFFSCVYCGFPVCCYVYLHTFSLKLCALIAFIVSEASVLQIGRSFSMVLLLQLCVCGGEVSWNCQSHAFFPWVCPYCRQMFVLPVWPLALTWSERILFLLLPASHCTLWYAVTLLYAGCVMYVYSTMLLVGIVKTDGTSLKNGKCRQLSCMVQGGDLQDFNRKQVNFCVLLTFS